MLNIPIVANHFFPLSGDMERLLFAVFLWICMGFAMSLEGFPNWGVQNSNKFEEILSRVTDEFLNKELAKSRGSFGKPRQNVGDAMFLLGNLLENKPMTLCKILWNTSEDDSLNECVAFLMQSRNEMLVKREQKRQGSYKFNSSGWKRKKRDLTDKLSRDEIMKLIQQILRVKKRRQFQATGW
jgi:hypothetical protein